MLFLFSLWARQYPHTSTSIVLSFFLCSISRSPSCTPQIHWSHLSALELWWGPGCDTLPQQCGMFHGRAWPWRRIPSGWRHGYTPRDVRGRDRDSAWQQCLWYFVCIWRQNWIEREWQSGRSCPCLSPALWIMTPEKGWGGDFSRWNNDFLIHPL